MKWVDFDETKHEDIIAAAVTNSEHFTNDYTGGVLRK